MAWVEQYRLEFKDTYGVLWTVKFYEDGGTAELINLTGTGEPLKLEWNSDSDDMFEPIHEMNAIIGVYSSANFSLANLYAAEDMYWLVNIYSGSDLRFTGYVDCGNYTEPYEDYPYPVSIKACDGLKYLKTIKYDDAGTYYNGRMLESAIILDILGKIGYTEFKEYINIYEESMTATSGYSPMDQLKIDVDVFRDMYCYEVLQEILKKYGAVITQRDSIFSIYRPVELDGATVYGRYFTGDTTKTSVSLTPQKYIDRSAHASDILQVPGGAQMVIKPAKKITLHQDYGNKESWIDNYEFLGNTYNSSTYKFDDWHYPGGGVQNIINVIKGEYHGTVLTCTTSGPGAEPIMDQQFGTYALACSDDFIIEFEYFFYSIVDSQDLTLYIKLKADNSNHWLYPFDDEEAKWDTSENWITVTETVSANSPTSWTTFRRQITSLPTNGTYTIGLYNGDATVSNAFWGIKNIKFYTTSDVLIPRRVKYYYPFWAQGLPLNIFAKKVVLPRYVIDNKEIFNYDWIKETAINGTDIEFEIILGDVPKTNESGETNGVGVDNIIEQFAGSLASFIGTAHQRVDTVTLTGTAGTVRIVCDEVSVTVDFTSDLPTTAAEFVTLHAAQFATHDITVTSDGADIIFTADNSGEDFTGDTTAENETTVPPGDLDGTSAYTTPAYTYAIDYTTDWNKRGGSESKGLLNILSDEIRTQLARPKQFIQMSLHDKCTSAPSVDVLGCYEDDVNQFSGNNRKFVVNAGEYDCKSRFFKLDLIELL